MIHTCASNNNPSSKELANCPGFNFNTRVWIYNYFFWSFRPPIKYIPKEVVLFRFLLENPTLLQSTVLLEVIYCRHRPEYFKHTITISCRVSHKLPGGTVNWSWTERELSIIYLSNWRIYSSCKAISVFCTVSPCSMVITLDLLWRKKIHEVAESQLNCLASS